MQFARILHFGGRISAIKIFIGAIFWHKNTETELKTTKSKWSEFTLSTHSETFLVITKLPQEEYSYIIGEC